MNRLAVSLVAICLIGCAGHASPLAGEHRVASVFLLDPTDVPGIYDYASLNVESFPSPRRAFNFYLHGKSLGRAELVKSADPEMGDGIVALFSPAMDIAAGTLTADRDINPDGRYAARPATHAEHAELILLEGSVEGPSVPSMPGDDARRSEVLTILTDRSGQIGDVAVHSSETYSMDANGEPALAAFLGIYVRSPSGQWRVEYTESKSGCDGCESQPSSWSLVGFGDVRGTGELTLLFTHLAYEGWGLSGYELSGTGKGEWISEAETAATHAIEVMSVGAAPISCACPRRDAPAPSSPTPPRNPLPDETNPCIRSDRHYGHLFGTSLPEGDKDRMGLWRPPDCVGMAANRAGVARL